MQTECIAEGIENMQVEFGVDADEDGTVDSYIADPTPDELQNAISARIYLLARTADENRGYTDERTYSISNTDDYKPSDKFRRRVHMTTVSIANVRNRILLGS
jgi:type IV pilus assembly protein PilW